MAVIYQERDAYTFKRAWYYRQKYGYRLFLHPGYRKWFLRCVLYEGCVLATGEMNYHDDSDFYAVVWDEEHQDVRRYEYATTRFGGGGHCSIDATMDTYRKAVHYARAKLVRHALRNRNKMAHEPTLGKLVEVVKGRKHKGVVGTIVWEGINRYNRFEKRYGLRVNGQEELVFVPAHYVQVRCPDFYRIATAAQVIAAVENNINRNWKSGHFWRALTHVPTYGVTFI